MGAKVHLLSHTPDPEGVIARATRLCYSPLGIEDLPGILDDDGRSRLLRKVISLGQHSVLEHAALTFGKIAEVRPRKRGKGEKEKKRKRELRCVPSSPLRPLTSAL